MEEELVAQVQALANRLDANVEAVYYVRMEIDIKQGAGTMKGFRWDQRTYCAAPEDFP